MEEMGYSDQDVVIAGAGLAGLVAACGFGVLGYRVALIDPTVEKTAAMGPDLRSTAFLQPAQTLLDRIGIWQRLEPFATPLRTMRIVDAASEQSPVARDFTSESIGDLPFGWNLPNRRLRLEILAFLSGLDTVDYLPGIGFDGVVTRNNEALVRLSDGRGLRTRLLIGADGRRSAVRSTAGISVRTRRYGQKAIVFAVTHPVAHENISTEVHQSGGPFTLVPLPDLDGTPASAVVWMETGPEAERLANLSEPAFNAAATRRSCEVFGPLSLHGGRQVWPIISQRAQRFTAQRIALIAEAAHVVPPIGAQGLNMSLADLQCLLERAENTSDLGGAAMLDAYEAERARDIRLRVDGVDVLNRASMTNRPTLQSLRATGLAAAHDIAPLRDRLMRLGLGLGR